MAELAPLAENEQAFPSAVRTGFHSRRVSDPNGESDGGRSIHHALCDFATSALNLCHVDP